MPLLKQQQKKPQLTKQQQHHKKPHKIPLMHLARILNLLCLYQLLLKKPNKPTHHKMPILAWHYKKLFMSYPQVKNKCMLKKKKSNQDSTFKS